MLTVVDPAILGISFKVYVFFCSLGFQELLGGIRADALPDMGSSQHKIHHPPMSQESPRHLHFEVPNPKP